MQASFCSMRSACVTVYKKRNYILPPPPLTSRLSSWTSRCLVNKKCFVSNLPAAILPPPVAGSRNDTDFKFNISILDNTRTKLREQRFEKKNKLVALPSCDTARNFVADNFNNGGSLQSRSLRDRTTSGNPQNKNRWVSSDATVLALFVS